MIIRKACFTDAESIAEIHADSWRKTYQRALTERYLFDIVPGERSEVWKDRLDNPKPNQHVLVAESDNDLIGFVCAYAGEHGKWGSYLDNLHIGTRHQSKGIGKRLLIEAARWCAQQEPGSGMCLLVNQDNLRAQHFYQGLGAHNAQEGVWDAPDGSRVPTYWYVWDSLTVFIENSEKS